MLLGHSQSPFLDFESDAKFAHLCVHGGCRGPGGTINRALTLVSCASSVQAQVCIVDQALTPLTIPVVVFVAVEDRLRATETRRLNAGAVVLDRLVFREEAKVRREVKCE